MGKKFITDDYLDDVDIEMLCPVHDLIEKINARTDVFYRIAGGFIRDCFSHDKPNDVDIWFKTKYEAEAFISNLGARKPEFMIYESNTSVTFRFWGYEIQVIFLDRLLFESASELIDSFDIRACCMSIDRFKNFVALDGACIDDAKEKNVDLWSKSRPANTLLRLTRLSYRGWKVDDETVKELL